jgi:hemerythrin
MINRGGIMDKKYSINWEDRFLIGVPIIDNQHKRLLDKIEFLLSAISENTGKAEIATIIKFLDSYVYGHFNTEERFMQDFSFPGIDNHKKEHAGFIEKFDDLKKVYYKEGGSKDLAVVIERELLKWYKEHIVTTDKALGHFLTEKGCADKGSLVQDYVENIYDSLDLFLVATSKDSKIKIIKEIREMTNNLEIQLHKQ